MLPPATAADPAGIPKPYLPIIDAPGQGCECESISRAGPCMLSILNVVLPVFLLLAIGYGAVRFRLFPAEGVKGLMEFVTNFCTPVLLFQGMVASDFGHAYNPAILFPFYLAAIFILAFAAVISRRLFNNRPGESIAAAFAATFSNTALVGIPIAQRAYGAEAMPVVFSIISLHAAVLLTLAMLAMELQRRDGAPLGSAIRTALVRILRNPLIWGVGAGLAVNLSHLPLPEAAGALVAMLAQAVLPVSLFSLGGALTAYRLSESWGQAVAMSLCKLILHPLLAYVMMVPVLHLDISLARYGVLVAGMPTGINAYIFASYYNRSVNVAANTVLITTALSLLTITGWLYLLAL